MVTSSSLVSLHACAEHSTLSALKLPHKMHFAISAGQDGLDSCLVNKNCNANGRKKTKKWDVS